MLEKNGNGVKLMLWIFSVIIFPTIFFIGKSVIANDQATRAREESIKTDLNSAVKEQLLTNQQILVKLAEVSTDVKQICGRKN